MSSNPLKLKEIRDNVAPFSDPEVTATGEVRASVDPRELRTLWINTGSLCNLSCDHCYIESTPTNDRLSFVSADDVRKLLDEIAELKFPTEEIGFTGGEPFLNKDIMPILTLCLEQGFSVLVLTNAMNTMYRNSRALDALRNRFGERLKLRVSLDHYTQSRHAGERGRHSWKPAIKGLRWLSDQGFTFSVAGRTFWGEDEADLRRGYAELFAQENIALDAFDASELILFPEMDLTAKVPEITTSCWDILGKNPADIMCASSRMVVKNKGDEHLSIMACTLLPYDQRFNLGRSLREAWQPVRLNHPHCAKFCVLGGGSCSQ